MRVREEEPFIVVAANRGLVQLADGRVGHLVWWSVTGTYATVVCHRRHVRVPKTDVVKILDNG